MKQFPARRAVVLLLAAVYAAARFAFAEIPEDTPEQPAVSAIDLYGTSQITAADVEERLGEPIRVMVAADMD